MESARRHPAVVLEKAGVLQERTVHKLFEFSVLLKGAHALIECVSGMALYLVSTETIVKWVRLATQDELLHDPHDVISNYLRQMAEGLSFNSKEFYAFYLLSHGVIKLLLVVGLLKNQLWSYPTSLAVLTGFIAYQLYRYSHTNSPGLLLLTAFDIIVMVLIWHEYRLVRHHLPLE
jgi:uncharacterized membrane protein